MDSDYPNTCCASSCDADFGFAFNDSNFSDRLLLIEIMSESAETQPGSEGCTSVADRVRRKRRRKDNKKENGGEAAISHNSGNVGSSTVVRIKKLYVSSPILAAKSPFFYKLFSNGMKESEQRHVTLRINASEEHALMELLSFIYSNSLSVATAPALLDVLVAADKFEVASCIKYCSKLLRNLPMTLESAPLYLELPSSVLMAEAVQPLTDSAKLCLAAHYRDITEFEGEVLKLPLSSVEAILSSDDLEVESEDAVYDFVLKWARARYPKLEDRQEVLGVRLASSIRFSCMTCGKLKEVLTCNDFDHDVANKLVLEALFFKVEALGR